MLQQRRQQMMCGLAEVRIDKECAAAMEYEPPLSVQGGFGSGAERVNTTTTYDLPKWKKDND